MFTLYYYVCRVSVDLNVYVLEILYLNIAIVFPIKLYFFPHGKSTLFDDYFGTDTGTHGGSARYKSILNTNNVCFFMDFRHLLGYIPNIIICLIEKKLFMSLPNC